MGSFSTVLIVFFNDFSEKKKISLDIIAIDPYVKYCWLNWLLLLPAKIGNSGRSF